MARIRTMKPEIRRSRTVCAWKYDVRWTFAGLPGYLDDAGRGEDDTRLIKAELYPIDDDMTAKKLDKHLALIADTGPLCRYEVDGKRYLHITSWAEHQRINRPTPSRIPPCPIHEINVTPHVRLSEPSSPHVRAEGKGKEQGARKGTGSVEGRGELDVVSPAPTDPDPQDQPGALAHPATTLDLLDRTGPYVTRIRGKLATEIDQLLADGISDQQIEAGLRAWRSRDAAPGLLPHLVQAELRTNPASRPSTTDAAVSGTLALARRLREQETHT